MYLSPSQLIALSLQLNVPVGDVPALLAIAKQLNVPVTRMPALIARWHYLAFGR
jgi:hypothetical protein